MEASRRSIRPRITADALVKFVTKYAANEAERLNVQPRGQLGTSVGATAAAGSLTYYLGETTDYFLSGPVGSEFPIYVGFLAISYMASQSLLSVCGKTTTKEILLSVLGGAGGGLSVGATIAGIALGLTADLITCGAFTLVGGALGFFLNRRGRKRHSCGMKLPCTTWICTKCKEIINPSDSWNTKDRWNILDVCQYLFVNGLKMNTVQALAFLDYTKLIEAARTIPGMAAVWEPEKIKEAVDSKKLEQFGSLWLEFSGTNDIKNPEVDIEKLLLKWEVFKNKKLRLD